ncbi:LacI family DNA-binding transcriptional regulator [Gemmobacter serpentinus]|uniref:LacI family DNA-binding transcriptional regulator n=1 Tax=Gemmobacter serpentinus TaxID=2652247 RepID=UPI00124D99BD|nr:LacI family DNA-binding transcriptional regulator [Gemmobacter serpentinus]
MAGIRDIARLSGTSIATVSRVLNNSGYVSAEMRARVEAAVRETGFQPNAGARQMRTQESRMIALVLPALDLHFFGILAHEVEQALFARGYTAMICSTAEDPEREAHYVSALLAQRVDGVLAVSVTQEAGAFRRLRDAGIPIVAIDRPLPDVTPHVVHADHRLGLRMTVEHLLALGHRDFALIGAPGHSWPIQERMAGARAALAAAGLAPLCTALGETHTFEACRDLMAGLFAEGHRPTAILGTTDIAAIGAIHAATARGMRVPGDVSVTGFDDLPAARFVVPQLTTVAQPIRAIGRQAVAELLALIAGDEAAETASEELGLRFVLRGTTQSVSGATPIR